MRSYLDFEKPVAELEAKVEELRAMGESGNAVVRRRRDRPPRGQGRAGAEGALCRADALAEDASGAASAAAALPRLHRRTDHRIRAARRRPQVRRGRGHRRRLRPLPRRERLRHRPREGLRHREPAQAQFRHGAAGGLPQGGAADEDGRPLRHSGDHAGRHRRRLSRHRRRGARPGRGHRALDRRLPVARRAQRRGDPRRRRLRRRHRARHRQPRADAGARDLFA